MLATTVAAWSRWPRSSPRRRCSPVSRPTRTGPAGGSVQTGVFPGEQRPGFVYLPPGFSRSQRYPVVYLLHGMPGSPTEYLLGTDLANWADTADRRGGDRAVHRRAAGGRARPAVQRRVGGRDRRAARASRSCRGSTRTCRRSRPPGPSDRGPLGRRLRRRRHRAPASRPLRDDRGVVGVLLAAARRAVQARVEIVLAANDPTKLAPTLAATLAPGSHALLPLHRAGAQPLVQAGTRRSPSPASCASSA